MKSSKKLMKSSIFRIVLYQLIIFIFIINFPIYAQAPIESLYGVFQKKMGVVSSGTSLSANQLATDQAGNIYIVGKYKGTVAFGNTCVPMSSVKGFEPKYAEDGFAVKYDITGNFQWVVRLATSGYDAISNIVSVDTNSAIFFGWFNEVTESIHTFTAADSNIIIYNNGDTSLLPVGNNNGGKAHYALLKIDARTGNKNLPNYWAKTMSKNNDSFSVLGIGKYKYADTLYAMEKGRSNFLLYSKYSINNGNLLSRKTTNTSYFSSGQDFFVSPSSIFFNGLVSIGGGNFEFTTIRMEMNNGFTIPRLLARSGKRNFNVLAAPNDSNIVNILREYDGANINPPDYQLMNRNFVSTNGNGSAMALINFKTASTNPSANDNRNRNNDTSTMWIFRIESDKSIPNTRTIVQNVLHNPKTDHLIVLGYFSGICNFDPLGTDPNKYKYTSRGGEDIFINIYDKKTGRCLNVVTLGGTSDDIVITGYMDASTNSLVLISQIASQKFTLDPSNRLPSIPNNGTSLFLSRYSLDSLTPIVPPQSGSFSDANNSRTTLGIANHDNVPCLALGNINNPITYPTSLNYFADKNPYNPNYDGIRTLFIPKDNNAIDSQFIYAKNTKNSRAYLRGWIDYNANGLFEVEETSYLNNIANANGATVVDPNTGVLSYQLYFKNLCPTNDRYNPGSMFMRIRLCSDYMDSLAVSGTLSDGEVEDYFVGRTRVEGSQPSIGISPVSIITQFQRIGQGDTMKNAIFVYSGKVNSIRAEGLDANIEAVLDTVQKIIVVRSKKGTDGKALPLIASCSYTIIVVDTSSRPLGHNNYFCSSNSISGSVTISYLRGLSLSVTPDTTVSNSVANCILSLNPAPLYDLFVTINSGGTAKIGIDYATPPSSLTIPAGQTNVPFNVNTLEGNILGNLSQVQLTATTPFDVYYNADTSFYIQQIPIPSQTVFSISADSTAIQEGNATKFKVSLPKGISTYNPVTVHLVKPTGDAAYRAFDTIDYKTDRLIDSVTIPALDSNTSFIINAHKDSIIELPEVVNIQLASIPAPSSPYHFTNANPDSATVIIGEMTIMDSANRVITLTVDPNILVGCNRNTIMVNFPPNITSSVPIRIYVDTIGSTAISNIHYVPITQPITIPANTNSSIANLDGNNDTQDSVLLQLKPFATPVYPTYPDFGYQRFQLPILPFIEPVITIIKEYNDTTDYLPCKRSMLNFKVTSANPLMSGKYQWYMNDEPIPDANDITMSTNILKHNDKVSCRFVYDFPCQGLLYTASNLLPVSFDTTCTILPEAYKDATLRIFTNPISRVHSLLRYAFLSTQGYVKVSFMVVDNGGRTIMANEVNGEDTKSYYGVFNCNILSSSVYMLISIAQKADGSSDVYSKNFIIE